MVQLFSPKPLIVAKIHLLATLMQKLYFNMHAGKPNSPFSAKILPFSAKTPVLGKISPFAVQSSRYPHAIFSIEINLARENYIVIEISGRFVKKFVLSGPLYII